MATSRRMPLHDLPLEQLLTPGSKTPRKHKRPLSPSRTTPLNPAKRRVLDAGGITPCSNVAMSSHPHPLPFNMHAMTPTRPSRLGNGLTRNHGCSQGALFPLSSQRPSPSRELYLKPTIESSTDPQSRHYPGFDVFRDSERQWDLPIPAIILPSVGDAPVDRSEEDKENVPLRRRAKKLSSKKRFLSGLDDSDASCFTTAAQKIKVAYRERTPFSARQALR